METEPGTVDLDRTLLAIARFLGAADIAEAQPVSLSTANALCWTHGEEKAARHAHQEIVASQRRLKAASASDGVLSKEARNARLELLRWLLALKHIEHGSEATALTAS